MAPGEAADPAASPGSFAHGRAKTSKQKLKGGMGMNVMKMLLAVIRTILAEFVDQLLHNIYASQSWG